MVISAISVSLDQAIVHLERRDITRATRYSHELLKALDGIPVSTTELVGNEALAELKRGIRDAIATLNQEPQSDPMKALRGLRVAWLSLGPSASARCN